ncbi:MAG TPA: phosphonate ABC transporter, permease protein PhnE [Chloroflexi bacterium]|nr:phosphonate ABC transporter, permease protein PhnE [Chloroflexota bacterium]
MDVTKPLLHQSSSDSRIMRRLLTSLVVVTIYWWAIQGTNTSLTHILEGIPFMAGYIKRMFPPDLSIINRLMVGAAETIQIAIMGTTLGALVALPLSFLAARNVMAVRVIYQATRSLFDVCRAVNEIVWALLFVAMVGLGPFPGVLALAVHLVGALGRYFSEAIETANPEVIKAIVATGANRTLVVVHGILSEIKPLIMGYVLYYFEHSVRAATILGLVGAGGIGFELITSIRLFKSQEVLTTLIVMMLMVVAVDRISAYVRNRIVQVEVIE